MAYVTFYNKDPNAPKPNMPAHLGSNCIITAGGKLLLEKRVDSDTWGLIGGGCKKWEEPSQAMAREVYEELGWRIKPAEFKKIKVYGEPGRIAAFRDGSIWRMVIVVFALEVNEDRPIRIGSESKEARFFTKEEIRDIDIAITHRDIVEECFLQVGTSV
ncbi:MAG: NUDIX domain-containing protein [Clostridia bacterium]|nr:NUDIX domain-containing protein [Clostridia bacterium]